MPFTDRLDARLSASFERSPFATIERLGRAVDASSDFIALLSPDGVFEYVNMAGRAMIGVASDRPATTLTPADMHEPAEFERVMHELVPSLARDGRWEGESRMRNRLSGETVPVHLQIYQVPDPEDGGIWVAAVARDLTDVYLAQAARERGEAVLGAMVDNSSDLVVIVGPDGRITFANPAITQLGYTPADALGEQLLDFVDAADIEAAIGLLSDALAGSPAIDRVDVRLVHADGTPRWYELIASPRFDEPALTGIVVSCRDVTERRRAAAIETHRARLSQLALDVSHGVLGADDLAPVLKAAVDGLGPMLGAHVCYLDRVDEDAGVIRNVVGWKDPGVADEAVTSWCVPIIDTRHWYDALCRGEPLVEPDLDQSPPDWFVHNDSIESVGTRALLAMPLMAAGRLFGVLGVECRTPRPWQDDEVATLRILSEVIAIALLRDRDRRELEASEARYRLLADNASDMVSVHQPDGKIEYVSPSCRTLLGYEPDELVGTDPFDLWHPDDLAAGVQALQSLLVTGDHQVLTMRLRRVDGSWVWVELVQRPVRDPHGRVVRFHGSTRDVTRRKALEDELLRQALHDPLTGLANRNLLVDRMAAAAHRRSRTGMAYSVLAIDLDGFKAVNDVSGHGAGDETLVHVAQRLARLTRQTDTVARVGGDEFVILCTDADPHHALRIAERVVGVMRIPIRHSSGWATIGASVGLAHANEAIDVDELLQTADRALYAAKRAGKGRVAVASQPGPGEGGHGELIAR